MSRFGRAILRAGEIGYNRATRLRSIPSRHLQIVSRADIKEDHDAIVSIASGVGQLRFSSVAGRTVMTRALAVSPLKLLNPRNAGASSWAYLATYGGGLVGGDALRIEIEVERGATALVATQASTKVYRSDRQASQEVRACVADEALLVLLPDPVSCFAGARYRQEQQLEIDQTANLVLVDRLTAGRVGSGERWNFNEYTSRTQIWRSGRLLLHDALSLTSEDGDLPRRMDRFNCFAVIVLIGPLLRAAAARLAGDIGSAPVARRAELLLSAAPLGSDGALVRVAGESVEQVDSVVRQSLGIVATLLGDDPWSHKW